MSDYPCCRYLNSDSQCALALDLGFGHIFCTGQPECRDYQPEEGK